MMWAAALLLSWSVVLEVCADDCQPLMSDYCGAFPYNRTRFPNFMEHHTQEQALATLSSILVNNLDCSEELRSFLCLLLFPPCFINMNHAIPPCASLCLRVSDSCGSEVSPVPCNTLPDFNFEMCIDEDEYSRHAGKNETTTKPEVTEPQFKWSFVFLISSIISFVFLFFTLLTFQVQPHRFPYPTRTIFLLYLCYTFLSLIYILQQQNNCENSSTSICHVIYILLYFFEMAGAIWWLIASFSWLCSAYLKWSEEAIQRRSILAHSLTWILSIFLIIFSMLNNSFGNSCNSIFRIGPHILVLVLGTVAFGSSILALVKTRSFLCREQERRFMLLLIYRVSLFWLSYCPFMALALCLSGCPGTSAAHLPVLLAIGLSPLAWLATPKTVHRWAKYFTPSNPPPPTTLETIT